MARRQWEAILTFVSLEEVWLFNFIFAHVVEEEGKSVYHNMIQYKLTDYFGDVVRCDYSQKNLWVPRPIFDAIVTDRMSNSFV